jgi:hypothetical protein
MLAAPVVGQPFALALPLPNATARMPNRTSRRLAFQLASVCIADSSRLQAKRCWFEELSALLGSVGYVSSVSLVQIAHVPQLTKRQYKTETWHSISRKDEN